MRAGDGTANGSPSHKQGATWKASWKGDSRAGQAVKQEVIPGYTGYMQSMHYGTCSLMGTYENCRKRAEQHAGPSHPASRYGSSFNPRSKSLSPNQMYNEANPRQKSNSKNRSSIVWGDNRDKQFTTMNTMQYLPHGNIIQESEQRDPNITPADRRKMYAKALQRVGKEGAAAVERAMKSKLAQKTAGGPGALRSAFKYFDRDGSGTIDLGEFFKVLEFMGLTFSHDQVVALFGQYDDEEATGELDYNLFVSRVMIQEAVPADYVSAIAAEKSKRLSKAVSTKIGQDSVKVARLDIKRVFDKYDFDKSGTIDAKELGALLKMLGAKLGQDDIHKVLEVVDTNHSGVIEFDEFWRWFQQDEGMTSVLSQRY